jgi:hypothetical protein
MEPRQFRLDKFFQEESSHQHATHSIADIGDVSDWGI